MKLNLLAQPMKGAQSFVCCLSWHDEDSKIEWTLAWLFCKTKRGLSNDAFDEENNNIATKLYYRICDQLDASSA
jgi:hypothetical protein